MNTFIDYFSFSSGDQKLQSDVNSSLPNNPSFSYPQKLQSKKIQNYFQFRSSEYQPYSFSKKQTDHSISNSSRLYMRNRTNMDNGQTIQEYSRYRSAAYQTPTKVCALIEMKRRNRVIYKFIVILIDWESSNDHKDHHTVRSKMDRARR
jgi:hypothetical protein